MMIGETIRKIRRARHMTQDALAELVSSYSGDDQKGISRQSISGWENGSAIPRTENLRAVARALGVPLSSLMDDDVPLMESNVTPVTPHRGKIVNVPLLSPEITACCGDGIPAYDEIQNAPDESFPFSIEGLGGIYDDMRPPYAVRADGACLEKSRIYDGDILVFNPALEPRQGKICIVCWDGALSAKKVVRLSGGGIQLQSDADSFSLSPEEASDPARFSIWGPVVIALHKVR